MRWQWRADSLPGNPAENMAADEALFLSLVRRDTDIPIVRVYGWDRPSVSYGRLQDETAVRDAYPDLPRVRRPTGGRAVLHGNDLTVSIICRDEHLPPVSGGVLSSYRLLVSPVTAALNALGVSAELGKGARSPGQSPVRCFDTVASCDVADPQTGRKLVGSAQRRDSGAILQQMSLPLAYLPSRKTFLAQLREEMAMAYEITAWELSPP